MIVLWPWRYILKGFNDFYLRNCVSGVRSLPTSLIGCAWIRRLPRMRYKKPAVLSQIISANFADVSVR
ncbi:hypothetical protein Hden_3530 [Hyphomicrobium denitrificans ATCC 51888]|uniref:Uncharacterized protein n=1 Tax=Hyphomicrobium denitrificans (strain ATCC 51888 / DSM 1869 / NCIMB 11706 / TK 0415) TaxID=582899 RepID=D8JYB7_HYPDA|nr:hypothetical protein Hden_3530 [Hyphomicrobium denitrificans ATCC 51888]